MVIIKYFGAIAEVTQCNEEKISVTDLKISDLIDLLCSRYDLKEDQMHFALNQNLVHLNSDTIIKDGDELALLSPFSGG